MPLFEGLTAIQIFELKIDFLKNNFGQFSFEKELAAEIIGEFNDNKKSFSLQTSKMLKLIDEKFPFVFLSEKELLAFGTTVLTKWKEGWLKMSTLVSRSTIVWEELIAVISLLTAEEIRQFINQFFKSGCFYFGKLGVLNKPKMIRFFEICVRLVSEFTEEFEKEKYRSEFRVSVRPGELLPDNNQFQNSDYIEFGYLIGLLEQANNNWQVSLTLKYLMILKAKLRNWLKKGNNKKQTYRKYKIVCEAVLKVFLKFELPEKDYCLVFKFLENAFKNSKENAIFEFKAGGKLLDLSLRILVQTQKTKIATRVFCFLQLFTFGETGFEFFYSNQRFSLLFQAAERMLEFFADFEFLGSLLFVLTFLLDLEGIHVGEKRIHKYLCGNFQIRFLRKLIAVDNHVLKEETNKILTLLNMPDMNEIDE